MSSQTALARAKSYGSAHAGAGSWMAARLTSAASGILFLWLVVFALANAGSGFEAVRHSLSGTFNASMMLLFIGINAWHTKLGVQVIVEDYVQRDQLKMLSLIAFNFILILLSVMAVVAVLKIAVGS